MEKTVSGLPFRNTSGPASLPAMLFGCDLRRPASTCVDPDTPTPGLGKKTTKKLPEPPGELQVETVFQCILNITTKLLDTHITAPG